MGILQERFKCGGADFAWAHSESLGNCVEVGEYLILKGEADDAYLFIDSWIYCLDIVEFLKNKGALK